MKNTNITHTWPTLSCHPLKHKAHVLRVPIPAIPRKPRSQFSSMLNPRVFVSFSWPFSTSRAHLPLSAHWHLQGAVISPQITHCRESHWEPYGKQMAPNWRPSISLFHLQLPAGPHVYRVLHYLELKMSKTQPTLPSNQPARLKSFCFS